MTDSTPLQLPSRVLLVATPNGGDWSALRDQLIGAGWRVDVFNPTPRADPRRPEPALPLLDGVKLAVMLISEAGAVDLPLNRRILLLAGELKGALGARNVIGCIEREAEPVLAGSGIACFAYERNRIDVLVPQIVSQLGQGSLQLAQPIGLRRAGTPWPERFGVANGRVSAEILVALGVLLVVATTLGVLGYQLFGTPRSRLSADFATTDGAAEVDGVPDGLEASEAGEGRQLPLGPGGAGSIHGLPARCVILTPKGQELGETIRCDEGVGGLVRSGFPGPWHNEIAAVVLDPGVLGEAILEPRGVGSGDELVELDSGGEKRLTNLGSAFGVQRLVFVFTANGQEVELSQGTAEGGNRATLTYRLDLD